MALLPRDFLDAVICIGVKDKGSFKALATGFLFGVKTGAKTEEGKVLYRTFLVTNRHVFSELERVVLRFNLSGAGSKTYELVLKNNNGQNQWMTHPNADIDIAAIVINLKKLSDDGIKYSIITDDNTAYLDVIRKEGITQGDGVFVLGFPMGIAGKERNYAVVRGGVIARLDDEIINNDYKFLIDAAVFPGNSGGPVFLKPEIASIQGTKAVGQAFLLGVISSYIPYVEKAVSEQTKQTRIVFIENSGIAGVVPMDFVLETVKPIMDVLKKKQTVPISDNKPILPEQAKKEQTEGVKQ